MCSIRNIYTRSSTSTQAATEAVAASVAAVAGLVVIPQLVARLTWLGFVVVFEKKKNEEISLTKDGNLHVSDGGRKHYALRRTSPHVTFPACAFFKAQRLNALDGGQHVLSLSCVNKNNLHHHAPCRPTSHRYLHNFHISNFHRIAKNPLNRTPQKQSISLVVWPNSHCSQVMSPRAS